MNVSIVVSASLILLGGLVAIGFLFTIEDKNEETLEAIWQRLAKANNLTFAPVGGRGIAISGECRNCSVLLQWISQNITNAPTTSISVEPLNYSEQKNILVKEFPLGQQLSAEQLQDLLMPTSLTYAAVKVVISEGGKSFSYEEPHIAARENYLQFLIDFLTMLANSYPKMLALGGGIIPALCNLAMDKNFPLHSVAEQLIHDIAEETVFQFGLKANYLFCSNCLTSYTSHEIHLKPWKSFTYYGCRTCGQSRQFLEGRSVVVLDSQMETERSIQNNYFQVNWLHYQKLFDFDRVEIIQATDEDVERFAVQVGNDTDEWRKPRYGPMTCVVSAQCQLSENTLRILERMFGEVKVEAL